MKILDTLRKSLGLPLPLSRSPKTAAALASTTSGTTATRANLRIGNRGFAQVHDITIKADDKVLGSMERNVFGKPLTQHSTSPMTGFMRTGYCESPRADFGNHSVAGILTSEFLEFSASRGNDLTQAGLTPGCKWCLCVSRWKEAFEARKGDADKVVPRIVLSATNERALEKVGLADLKRFAVDGEGEGK